MSFRFVLFGLASVLLLLAGSGCGGSQPVPPSGLDEAQTAGWRAYNDLKCGSCHGDERQGQRSGPALLRLERYWTAAELVEYLIDPDAVLEADPKLKYRTEKFAIGMPAASAKSPGYADKARAEKLKHLADYLLIDPEFASD
ncbi:MAG: c-type cytochrome [Thermoanaerobaculales bacterium]|jgi:hypothetical protein|nr:c-type cytochrome [Thermoanaerobaculales bacterium]